MTDYTRPLLLGYARRDLYPSDEHVERLKDELQKFAAVEGFAMGSIYVERRATAPAAFNALVESLNRYELTAVVIPGWQHLELIGDPGTVKQEFEQVTGARLMLYDPGP
ncbi:hypothetical protein ACFCV3_31890 [Kribbella sp. NPDC056345]|uniref:hypothetical protein n=1 Tax=Kribbella sp. NPDC056345 TaxID=3345789 RepID=UPI0035E2F78D